MPEIFQLNNKTQQLTTHDVMPNAAIDQMVSFLPPQYFSTLPCLAYNDNSAISTNTAATFIAGKIANQNSVQTQLFCDNNNKTKGNRLQLTLEVLSTYFQVFLQRSTCYAVPERLIRPRSPLTLLDSTRIIIGN